MLNNVFNVMSFQQKYRSNGKPWLLILACLKLSTFSVLKYIDSLITLCPVIEFHQNALVLNQSEMIEICAVRLFLL